MTPLSLLAVEDSDEDWIVLGRVLRSHGDRVALRRFPSADGVLDALRDGPHVDALLIDLNLPTLRGPELVRRIRAEPDLAPLVVVVLSGSARPEDIAEVYAAGATAYLRKPLDPGELREALGRLVAWLEVIELPGPASVRNRTAWT